MASARGLFLIVISTILVLIQRSEVSAHVLIKIEKLSSKIYCRTPFAAEKREDDRGKR